jgi:hypothetical protein
VPGIVSGAVVRVETTSLETAGVAAAATPLLARLVMAAVAATTASRDVDMGTSLVGTIDAASVGPVAERAAKPAFGCAAGCVGLPFRYRANRRPAR